MNEQDVGRNIRALRLAAGATLAAVAGKAGLTKSTLSKIETGQISSPISTLVAIAGALGVHLSEFFRENKDEPRYLLTRKGQGRTIVRDGTRLGYGYEALAADFPGKPLEPFLLTISPGDKEGTFRHSGHEFVYVLSGRVVFTIGDDEMILKPGDSLYFDPTQTHSVRLMGKTPARFLCLFIETP